ncbi:MAG TPA: transcription-repair coupling factor [Actinomycetota bacterium]|nr:transcription-repair coupling factor [Actinomycetota bacterium]
MDLSRVLSDVAVSPELAEAVDALALRQAVTVADQARTVLPAVWSLDPARPPMLLIAPSSRDAERITAEINAWRSGGAVLFPAWETLPHERLSPRAETIGRRLEALWRLRVPPEDGVAPKVIVAPVRAAVQRMVPGVESLSPIIVRTGEWLDVQDLVRRLAGAQYERVDMVGRRGEFAVRGGLVDVFPATADHPVRLDFFGDEVTSMREFAVSSQRSIRDVERIVAFSCRELIPTDEVRGRAIAALERAPHLRPELMRLADGITFEGMEALIEVLWDTLPVLREILPDDTLTVVLEPKRTADRAAEMLQEVEAMREAMWAAAADGARPPADNTYAELDAAIGPEPRAALSPFRGDGPALDAKPWETRDIDALAAEVRRLLQGGSRVIVAAESHGSADRIRELLAGHELFLPRYDGGELPPARGAVTVAPIDEGFVSESLGLAVVGEHDLFGKRRPHREPKAKRRSIIALELEPGDLVVHAIHGIGRFTGMVTREVGTGKTDYLVLEYAAGDTLYVPADTLDLVTKYVGGEPPKLHRLGGKDWDKQKARVKKAVRDMADELIKLYSQRAAAHGHAFGQDTPWQRELEDTFPYIETKDQLAAIEDVKADMERPAPMDRLVCGDVGFGKTEIAIRAAFKAVADGKQVAVLVPTTLLAQQHYATFSERYAPFPVRVAVLSRFVTPKEQKRVIDEIAAGKIDVVIGTHRLLNKDVTFADLGLLIVDEEQRFGVAHKEAIKKLKTNVDVLTMTATPIPRTLEMSMSGIRDLSVIDTPPEDRHPVLTFVGPFDEPTVAAAIRREMLREGQVFYVHNRVHDIERSTQTIRKLVPEARIGVAHGQMSERQLEKIMLDFWDREYDVLVSTTIIESGLDIPTANTIIVDRADQLGLSQMYQLRGRVGRARERAYAYFFFPPERSLTEQSHARLSALSQHTELGSGLQIALRDLEIRGAGNLLGGAQHGHITSVGFDLYVQMLADAVDEARGKLPEPKPDVKVDIAVDAHLPESWIPREGLRLEAYRRVAQAPSHEALADVRAELLDRYGELPPQAETLLTVASIKLDLGLRGVRTVSAGGGKARFEPFVLAESEQVRVRRLFPGSVYKTNTYTLILPMPAAETPAAWLRRAVSDILAP